MNKVIGFDSLENKIIDLFIKKKLHHCNIINGVKGIGKASFIYNIAATILSEGQNGNFNYNEENIHRHFKLIQANTHPDILILDINSLDDEGNENTGVKREINVAQTRKVVGSINYTNSLSKNKVLIVDAINELNEKAQNILLKTLEEPPKNTYIFLICHNLSEVLETIISRCNIFNIVFDFDTYHSIMEKSMDKEYINILFEISNSSIQFSNKFLELKGFELYKQIIDLFVKKDIIEIQNFTEGLEKNNELYNIFIDIIENIFKNIIYILNNYKVNNLSKMYESLLLKTNMNKIINDYDYFLNTINDIYKYNLSKQHCLSVLFQKVF